MYERPLLLTAIIVGLLSLVNLGAVHAAPGSPSAPAQMLARHCGG